MQDEVLPPLALLAGGLSTRLRPLTNTVPKSMVAVAGEPFIAHQLRWLARQRVTRVMICCGFLGEQIEAFVGNGHAFGCTVEYSHDGFPLKGTGGALRHALPRLGDRFFVLYGDSYLPIAFRPVSQQMLRSKKLGLMTVFRNENKWDRSNVEMEDGCIRIYDKQSQTPRMRHIDYGLGMLSPAAFKPWEQESVFDLSAVYARLVETNQLSGYEVNERFYEIGTPEGLRETEHHLSPSHAETALPRRTGCLLPEHH